MYFFFFLHMGNLHLTSAHYVVKGEFLVINPFLCVPWHSNQNTNAAAAKSFLGHEKFRTATKSLSSFPHVSLDLFAHTSPTSNIFFIA